VARTARREDQRMRALSKRGQYWAKILAEHAASRQGMRAICRRRQAKEARFYAWRCWRHVVVAPISPACWPRLFSRPQRPPRLRLSL